MTLTERIIYIETRINCKIIYLNGFFTRSSFAHLRDLIKCQQNCSYDNFLLVLKSNGGDNVFEPGYSSIRELLVEPLNGKQFWVLINEEVASTGTVLSFSADRLFYLNTKCKIGPIDPQKDLKGTSFLPNGTKLELNWDEKSIVSPYIEDQKGLETIKASMRSLLLGHVIDINNMDLAFKYLLNINDDFKNHSDRKEIFDLPLYLKKSLADVNSIIEKKLFEKIICDLDLLRWDSNYYIHSI